MPIPFILGGIALAAGAYGVKKGYDAKCDFDDAKDYNSMAQKIFTEAQESLNNARKYTNSNMEELGGLKLKLYRETLLDFVEIFSEIKNVDFEDKLDLNFSIADIDFKNILEIKNDSLKIIELAGGATAALGGGALAGFGAFGGAGMLATASTGTAIGSLSGVAATNATLAWFGGGSLAAGGFGMAGGMVVLGGIVAGPVLAVAGGLMASKAETAKNYAKTNINTAKAAAEEMKSATVVVESINERVVEFLNILKLLTNEFESYIDKMDNIVLKNKDYATYNENSKKTIMITLSIAQTVKNICDTPIIDENGEITRKSKRVLLRAKEFCSKLENM